MLQHKQRANVQIQTNKKFFYAASQEQPRFIQRTRFLQHKQRANVQIHTKRKFFYTVSQKQPRFFQRAGILIIAGQEHR